MEQRSVALAPIELAEDQLGFFRWGHVGGKVLVTNDAGEWLFMTESEFAELLAGKVAESHPRQQEYQAKGLIRDGLDLDAFANRVAERNRHVSRGPHVHVVTLTLRSNQPGSAQDSQDAAGDMTREVAEKIVNLAMQSPSPALTFEFQGGEPLLNFEVLRHLVEHAQTRNQRVEGKVLSFSLLTTFAGMTEEIAEWLIANEVAINTSLDGPAAIHDKVRAWKGGSSHADVVRWLEYFGRRYSELGRSPELCRVTGLLTVTRQTLSACREVVDEYVTRGLRSIRLQPLRALGLSSKLWAEVGYDLKDYLAFYRQALDYVLELNRKGVPLSERTASTVLSKILASGDSSAVDLQSPGGEGTGQVVYGPDGSVFPSEDARQLAALGDPFFLLGNAKDLSLSDLVHHPTVRALAAASLLDAQPLCSDCWNKPYCGFSPVRNFITQGDLLGQRLRCLECKEHFSVSTRLFELLGDTKDTKTGEILSQWGSQARLAGEGRLSHPAP